MADRRDRDGRSHQRAPRPVAAALLARTSARPATSQAGTTFPSRQNFYFLERRNPTSIFQRAKLAPS
jgi:hypothetical protein